MPISVTCGACKKSFTVPDHYAGKTGKCTKCGAPIVAAPPASASSEQLGAFATDPKEAQRDEVGVVSTLAGYKLQKRLGGEKSTVFLAEGPKGPVALKVLPRAQTEKSPTAAKRFLREARSLFGLEHPNVVSCLDAGEELGTLYLVMELFSGRTVRDLMKERGGKVPLDEALGLGLQVARGLEHLSAQKLVHRNLMPEHILVGADGTAKIVGLGLVKSEDTSADQPLTMKGVSVGTPQYMSPEQARGAPELDSRSDLWSLGITLFEMLAGEVPFNHKSPLRTLQMVEKDPLPPLRDKNPEVTPHALAVVEKLLTKDREERYASPAELASDLEAIADGRAPALGGGAKPAPSKTSKAAKVSQVQPAGDPLVTKLLVAVVILGLAVLGLLGAVLYLVTKR